MSNPVQILTRGFGSSTPTFVVIMPIWMSLKSLIANISQSSISLDLFAPKRVCGTPLLVPREWLVVLGKDSAPSVKSSWCVLDMNPGCFVCEVGQTMFMFMSFTVTQGTMVQCMSVSLIL